MPRIDPQQLLVCLTPLLAANGGIKSTAEVIRLASLMEKYSKKLVSKCIYIQILKCTETDLLGQFMSAGGWNLVHTWLKDGSESSNWPFVEDILEMLLLCPVDGNRLKSNHTPKIVKNLSLSGSQNVRILSTRLVEQWLKIAHQEKQQQEQQHQQQNNNNGVNGTSIHNNNNLNNVVNDDKKLLLVNDKMNESVIKNEITELQSSSENNNTTNVNNGSDSDVSKKPSSENLNLVKYKISNKESGLVLSIKRSTSPSLVDVKEEKDSKSPEIKSKSIKLSNSNNSGSDKDKKKSSSSSHKSSSSSKSSHRDKERSSSSSHHHHRSSSSSSKDKHSKSSSHSSSKHSSSSSSSSSSSNRDKEKRKKDVEKEQAEKDKETLNFLTPLPSSKLQRIPKRQLTDNGENKEDQEPSAKAAKTEAPVEKKKPSISIEVRKGEKPKTVKTLNSQFRNHGLAEDPPPPPSRKGLTKKTTATPTPTITPVIIPTLSMSTKSATSPTINKKIEKALESEVPERAGGVKLIKPKPMLIESTGFLDALDATRVPSKKDPKKRKRTTSTSGSSNKKDEPESPKIEAKPLKFYNDTMEEEENNASSPTSKDKESSPKRNDENASEIASPKDENSPKNEEENDEPEEKRGPGIGTGPDGPPGVLVNPLIPRKKKAKKSIRWRPDTELTDIRYFELDENERVNVTKTFIEQKQMEHNLERNGFLMGRKLHSEDVMTEQISWRPLKLISNVPEINYGYRSREINIQLEREKNTLQDLYLAGAISDSPHEPDVEMHDHEEPVTIPLEDVTGNPDAVADFRSVSWPKPKTDIPLSNSNAFVGLFNSIPPIMPTNLNIPPAQIMATTLPPNPLASLGINSINTINPLNAINSPWQHGIISNPTAAIASVIPQPFLQAPPPPIIPNNYQSVNGFQQSRNNYNSAGSATSNNNNDRNRGGGSAGNSNWVRGNASSNQPMRKGTCFQYQKTGFCRRKGNGCPYIH